MLTDCAAMTVDVVSYFINYVAEKLKDGRHERTELYLELFPPIFSVITLVVVTAVALRNSLATLERAHDPPDDASLLHNHDPNIGLMLLFSSMNLVLDFLNVGCFARTGGDGTPTTSHEHRSTTTVAYGTADEECLPTTSRKAAATERSKLLGTAGSTNGKENDHHRCDHNNDDDDDEDASFFVIRNLNMCSAWTHVCADTLRSVAVLLAAGLATLFPDYISPVAADSNGTIVVSLVILISLGPLLHGLYRTARQIVKLERALREMERV
jgi:Co/Zn/Cd efflux system component